MAGVVDLARWPIADLGSAAAQRVIAQAREALRRSGACSFENFLLPDAVAEAAAEARALAPKAWVTDDTHNAYQLEGDDPSLASNHVRNAQLRTRVASSAWDELLPTGVLRQLYMWEGLPPFIGAVTGQATPHRLADPLGACSVNVFRPGWYHGWHFDEAEFTTTVCLQQATSGGAFEFTPPMRASASELAADAVAATISKYSLNGEGSSCTPDGGAAVNVSTAPFPPGTLQIFAGRYCLHRVTPTQGTQDRLVGVLCFASEPGVVNSPQVQQMFWGRTSTAGLPKL